MIAYLTKFKYCVMTSKHLYEILYKLFLKEVGF